MSLPGLFVRKQDFVRRRHRGVSLLATTALIPLSAGAALANPVGGQVVGGNATIQGQGTSTVTVTQSTDRAIINWNTFNLGAGDKTQFVQPNSSSITLDRVTGGLGASQIYGTIAANGRVFLVNPDGILFGAGAKINVAGFLATTNDIKNADSWPAVILSLFRATPRPRSPTREPSQRSPAASPHWLRPACAIPEPSRQRLARLPSRQATPLHSISMATSSSSSRSAIQSPPTLRTWPRDCRSVRWSRTKVFSRPTAAK